jgi:lipoyl synthase
MPDYPVNQGSEFSEKLRGAEKLARIPVKIEPTQKQDYLRKPSWLRPSLGDAIKVNHLRKTLRENRLHTVCEEANCPNLGECFSSGTATFMIMGDICTRRCPFCDVAHGRPLPLDDEEPENLARTVAAMGLNYVVITSVDRDDLRDGGAAHFVQCIRAARQHSPAILVEILTPDFRSRSVIALDTLSGELPDVFNHNIETVPRLYREVRPGSSYTHSLDLLSAAKQRFPHVETKSGLMLGLGESDDEILGVLRDLRAHGVDSVTLGQYLQPSIHHLPVKRYVSPEEFEHLRRAGRDIGFKNVASGPLVRSSYHAEQQFRSAR